MAIVYIAYNKANGKRYIGATEKSVEHRAARHKWNAIGGKKKSRFYAAIRKYGFDAFEFKVLRDCNDFYDALDWEARLIAELKPEYNLTAGGGGIKGFKFSEESKAKLSAAKRGRPNHWSNGAMPQELRDKLAAKARAKKGVPINSIQRAAILANAQKGNAARRRAVICITDGKRYESLSAAAKEYELTTGQITYYCQGNHESRRGWDFKYDD